MLLPRVLTALVGIPLIAWLVHLGSLPFLGFVLVVIALCLHEYGTALALGAKPVQRFWTVFGGLAAALACLADAFSPEPAARAALVLTLTLLPIGAILLELSDRERSLERLGLTMFGIYFIGWNLAHLVLIRELRPHGEVLTWWLLITVWVMDTAAYFGGRALGRRPLAESVSPKKTWEGAAAGFASALLVALAFRLAFPPGSLSVGGALLLGALIGVIGQVSDLAESVLKRGAGVKDSSNLLPGHGGVLDRFDSFLLAAPLYFYALPLVLERLR